MISAARVLSFLFFLSFGLGGGAEKSSTRPPIQAETKSADRSQKFVHAIPGFTLVRVSNGIKDDGAPFSSNMYETEADKQKVWVDFFHYDSPEAVKKAFDVQVKEATKIVEKGPLLDAQGQAIGERAVLIFNPPDKKASAMILWTSGNRLRDLQSFSLDTALEFEKQAHAAAQEKKQ